MSKRFFLGTVAVAVLVLVGVIWFFFDQAERGRAEVERKQQEDQYWRRKKEIADDNDRASRERERQYQQEDDNRRRDAEMKRLLQKRP